jgi:hypothetical protein
MEPEASYIVVRSPPLDTILTQLNVLYSLPVSIFMNSVLTYLIRHAYDFTVLSFVKVLHWHTF